MKNLIYLLVIFGLLFTSCKKKTIYPTDQLPANVPTGTNFGGVSMWNTFKLIGSQKLFDVCWTGHPTFFTDSDTSSMRWGGSALPIENYIKNITTWKFIAPVNGEGKFILNGNSTLHFIVNYVGQYSTILNDSQDPNHATGTNISFKGITVIGNGYTAADSVVSITINNGYYYHHIDGHDYEYKNVLLFKKQ